MTSLFRARHHHCRISEFGWHGHRLIVLENEFLKISVLASKGADIVEFRYKPHDLDLLWHAPQPAIPPGQLVGTSARQQGAFLDFYAGGWQEVLPNAGPATIYKGAELGQHGEVALLPWDVRVVDDQASHISVEFSVETMRTPFRLVRTMSLESGSCELVIDESLTNVGEEDMHFAWGHHPALGAPFLEAGSLIEFPNCDVSQPSRFEALKRRFAVGKSGTFPSLELAAGGQGRVDEVKGKETRTEDILVLGGFSEGRCSVINPRSKLSFSLTWDPKVFPYFWCWQVYGGSWGYPYFGRAYTLAMEPFNCPLMSLAEAVEAGVAQAISASGTIKTSLAAKVVDASHD